MNIFGKLDAANIPTSPFFIEAGEYSAEVTKATYKENREGQKQLLIEYTITNEESQFLDSKATQFFTLVDPEMTSEKLELLPAEEKKRIRQSLASLKRTLCGNDNNSSQQGLGVDINDLNDDNWDPATLIGTKVDLAISNYGTNNQGVNIRWANIKD